MQLNIQKPVQVVAKVLSLHLKVCDEFTATLKDDRGETLLDYEGYVPGFMPGEHFGDYVQLDIDIDTGKILNWVTPTAEQIESFIAGDDSG